MARPELRRGRRRVLCPQVVQTSAMDCGPAAVKSLLEAVGLEASYARLREACQTEVDGTAIGSLEALLGQLGLPVEQVMLPVDHFLLDPRNLPSIAVVVTGAGLTHYVVVWRRHGGRLQVMDPAVGRRFPSHAAFVDSLYRHRHPVEVESWRAWAGSDEFTDILRLRLERLGIAPSGLVGEALANASWHGPAALDAATRCTQSLVDDGIELDAADAETFVRSLVDRAVDALRTGTAPSAIPERFWSVWPTEPAAGEAQTAPDEILELRGAVLLRPAAEPMAETRGPVAEPMVEAIRRGDPSPWRRLADLAPRSLRRGALMLSAGTAAAACLRAGEAALLFGLLHGAAQLAGLGQLATALLVLLIALGCIGALELALATGARRLGRDLELTLRTSFLRSIPGLGDRFFASRLRSDIAERAHSVVGLRELPSHLAELVGAAAGLLATTAALAWFFPDSAWLAALLATISVLVPWLGRTALDEQAASLRAYAGSLSNVMLDALAGATTVRAHSAASALRREQDTILDHWLAAAFSFTRRAITVHTLQAALGLGLAATIVLQHTATHGVGGGVLLLTYWALALPQLGAALALVAQQLPDERSLIERITEPITAASPPPTEPPRRPDGRRGAELRFDAVDVVAGGQTILRSVDATIRAGETIAIVGTSGAGKSTWLSLLLGWHSPAAGRLTVDGEPLDAERLASLRPRTAWVDPAVTLWNRSLLANIRYGDPDGAAPLEAISHRAALRELIQSLPRGLATLLGERGGLLAGGEGQRVRLARALARRDADLVLLDEPFRGLEAPRRRELLDGALAWWRGATILCATHDVALCDAFDRVAVLDGGRLVELDTPSALAATPTSRFAALRARDESRHRLWRSDRWRRLDLRAGVLARPAATPDVGGDRAP
ncbi:MAG: ATP-binding cassette domain-containing protein [Acidobacteriota bacterium]